MQNIEQQARVLAAGLTAKTIRKNIPHHINHVVGPRCRVRSIIA
jgi:hypothetical protein